MLVCNECTISLLCLFPLLLDKLNSCSPFHVTCSSGNFFSRYISMVLRSFWLMSAKGMHFSMISNSPAAFSLSPLSCISLPPAAALLSAFKTFGSFWQSFRNFAPYFPFHEVSESYHILCFTPRRDLVARAFGRKKDQNSTLRGAWIWHRSDCCFCFRTAG